MNELCAKHFWREHFFALQIFLCALISRPVCARTQAHVQLRENIDDNITQAY